MVTKDLLPTLREMYPARKELVPLVLGEPGIGKTEAPNQLAEELGVKCVTFILSNTVPSEVSGIRMPDTETKSLEVFDDSRMASLEDGDILFFDEFLEAPPQIWSACLTLIQNRIMASGRKLPDVFIVAASNPVATPKSIPDSVRDRFCFIDLKFDWSDWKQYVNQKYGWLPDDWINDYRMMCGDDDRYNVLSPRKITKLGLWLQEGVTALKLDIIAEMWNRELADKLAEMVDPASNILKQRHQREQMWDAATINLAGYSPKIMGVDKARFMELSDREILHLLQSMPEWEQIKEALMAIEAESEEGEDENDSEAPAWEPPVTVDVCS